MSGIYQPNKTSFHADDFNALCEKYCDLHNCTHSVYGEILDDTLVLTFSTHNSIEFGWSDEPIEEHCLSISVKNLPEHIVTKGIKNLPLFVIYFIREQYRSQLQWYR